MELAHVFKKATESKTTGKVKKADMPSFTPGSAGMKTADTKKKVARLASVSATLGTTY